MHGLSRPSAAPYEALPVKACQVTFSQVLHISLARPAELRLRSAELNVILLIE
jgi:hypothetical protein